MRNIPTDWQSTAFNQVPDSSNQIHSDELAQSLGFSGALVPGVTVSAYLLHPGLTAWGSEFLERTHAQVTVHKPLYDGHDFRVEVKHASDERYSASLIDETNVLCATASVQLLDALPKMPTMRGDLLLDQHFQAPDATPENMAALKLHGMRALSSVWESAHPMSTYLKEPNCMPELLRMDGTGRANAAFLLGLTNKVLAGNAKMNPWIHLQTTSTFFSAVPLNTEILVECAINDLFHKKGHEFVDLEVSAYKRATGRAVLSAELRAIYQVRGATL